MSEPSDTQIQAAKEQTKKRLPFHIRGFTSIVLFLAFFIAAVAGIMLYFTPRGRVANWTGWTLFGLEKDQWSAIHMVASLVLLISAIIHLYYNWTVFWSYVKKRFELGLNLKREMALAFVLMAVCVAGAVYDWPPFSYLVDSQLAIRDYWEQESAPSPFPHADELTLERLARQRGLTMEVVLERLSAAGITGAGREVTLGELAERHEKTPDELFAIVDPDFRARGRGGMGEGRMGIGRGRGRDGEERSGGDGRGYRGGRGGY